MDNKPTIKKTFSAKKVVFGYETDLTGGLFTNVTAYNEYYYLIDFVATRSSKQAEFINSTTVKLTNVKKPILPPELQGSFDELNWFKVYINGVLQTPLDYTYYYDGGAYTQNVPANLASAITLKTKDGNASHTWVNFKTASTKLKKV